jgi:hypothetical protein
VDCGFRVRLPVPLKCLKKEKEEGIPKQPKRQLNPLFSFLHSLWKVVQTKMAAGNVS